MSSKKKNGYFYPCLDTLSYTSEIINTLKAKEMLSTVPWNKMFFFAHTAAGDM